MSCMAVCDTIKRGARSWKRAHWPFEMFVQVNRVEIGTKRS